MVYLQNGRNLRPILSADTHYAADKSDSQKREVTHKRLRGPAPGLLSGRGRSRVRAQARVQRLLESPPLQPGGPGSRELSPCSLFSLVLLPLGEAGFLCSRCATAGPSWPEAACCCHQETPVSLNQTRGTRQEPETFLRVRVQPRAAMLQEPAYCWGKTCWVSGALPGPQPRVRTQRDSRWASCLQRPRVTEQGPPCLPCGPESPPFWKDLTCTPAALTASHEVLVSRTRAASGSCHLQGAGTTQSSHHLPHYFWGLADSSCSHSHFPEGPKNLLVQEPNAPGSFFSVSFYNNNLGLEPQFGNK